MKHEIIHTIFERGGENTAFAQYFVGQSYLNMLSTQGVAIGNVTFAPGCRNNWHIHHASKGGDRSCCALAAGGGTKRKGSPPARCVPGTWSISQQASNTGMGRKRTAGSSIWQWRSQGKAPAMNGVSRSAMRNIPN